MRAMGDQYVKTEFRLHQKSEKEGVIEKFHFEWDNYLKFLQQQNGTFGRDLNDTEKQQLSGEQVEKLVQLQEDTISRKK